ETFELIEASWPYKCMVRPRDKRRYGMERSDRYAPECCPDHSLARQSRLHGLGLLLQHRDAARYGTSQKRRGTRYSDPLTTSFLRRSAICETPNASDQREANYQLVESG